MVLPQEGEKPSARLRQGGHGMRTYEQLAGRHLGGGAQADHRGCASGEEGLGAGTVGSRSVNRDVV